MDNTSISDSIIREKSQKKYKRIRIRIKTKNKGEILRFISMMFEIEVKRIPANLKYRVKFYYLMKYYGIDGGDLKVYGIKTIDDFGKELKYISEIIVFLGGGNFIIWDANKKELRINSEKLALLDFLEFQPALFGEWKKY